MCGVSMGQPGRLYNRPVIVAVIWVVLVLGMGASKI